MQIIATDIDDPETIAAAWRTLEERSSCPFFQGWTWTGCLVGERYPDPLLVTATQGGVTVGMALFNRAPGRRLLLGESGDPSLDSIYSEYNGVLLDRGQSPTLAAQLARAALAHAGGRDGRTWRLTGRRMAAGQYLGLRAMNLPIADRDPTVSWAIDFTRLRHAGSDTISIFGSNTRSAVRRSLQAYAREGGVSITRAATLAEAHAFLDELIALHQAFRLARGQPGAFADPFMRRFHRTLIARGLPRDEIDVLRIATPSGTLGLVYNFRHKGRVLSYQSGFAVEQAGRREKPGLTGYALCAAKYLAAGVDSYDFLAGDAAYKRNITNIYAVMF